MNARSFERVLLIGFMGAGKTSVGRALARALDWRFVDFDDEIERRAGAEVTQIFAQAGEGRFRALEKEVGDDLLGRRGVVLGSGGGWAARPGRVEGVPSGTVVVWLRVGAEEALRRSGGQPGRRPLLDDPDPLSRARELLAERLPFYAAADHGVDTEGSSVDDVTSRILEILDALGTPTETE